MLNPNVRCPICRQGVMRSSSGILLHTKLAPEGRASVADSICSGSTHGARPDGPR